MGDVRDVGGGCSRIGRPSVNLPNGHWVKDSVLTTVIPPNKHESLYVERTLDCNCITMPTSWHFRVTFTRFRGDDVSCVSTVKRTDRGTGLVNVQFWTTVRIDPPRFDVAVVKHFISGLAPPRNDMHVHKAFIDPTDAERLEPRNLNVEFLFIVHGCHCAQYVPGSSVFREESMATDDSQDDCSQGSTTRKRPFSEIS